MLIDSFNMVTEKNVELIGIIPEKAATVQVFLDRHFAVSYMFLPQNSTAVKDASTRLKNVVVKVGRYADIKLAAITEEPAKINATVKYSLPMTASIDIYGLYFHTWNRLRQIGRYGF